VIFGTVIPPEGKKPKAQRITSTINSVTNIQEV
jgi:hypothetical protein